MSCLISYIPQALLQSFTEVLCVPLPSYYTGVVSSIHLQVPGKCGNCHPPLLWAQEVQTQNSIAAIIDLRLGGQSIVTSFEEQAIIDSNSHSGAQSPISGKVDCIPGIHPPKISGRPRSRRAAAFQFQCFPQLKIVRFETYSESDMSSRLIWVSWVWHVRDRSMLLIGHVSS